MPISENPKRQRTAENAGARIDAAVLFRVSAANTQIVNNFEIKEPSECGPAQTKDKEEDAKAAEPEGDELPPNEESWFTFLSIHEE